MPTRPSTATTRPVRAPWAATLVAASAAAILYATLRPTGARPPGAVCWFSGDIWLADLVRNVALFLPLGLCLSLAGVSRSRLLLLAAALSAAIELLQFTVITGRCTSPADLLANVLGALLGWVAWRTAAHFRARDPRCGRMALVLLAGWWLQCAMTSWGVRPWFPDSATYFGQWAHVFPGYVPLPGRVRDVRLHAMPIPDDSLPDTPAAKRLLADSAIVFVVRTEGLPEVPGLAQLAALTDANRRFASLGMRGCRVEALATIAAERIGLETITLGTEPACVSAPTEVRTTMAYDGRRFSLDVRNDGGVLGHTELPLSPALGWALIRPVTTTGAKLQAMSLGWIALVFALPIGLLGMRGRRWNWSGVALIIGAMWAGLALPPWLLHTGRATPAEYLATAVAVTLGAALARGRRTT